MNNTDAAPAPAAARWRGVCGDCLAALPADPEALARSGAALESRARALVRVCARHSARGTPQMVNSWWSCRDWRAGGC